tara:strand:+ start:684 stop:1439 length:756 start_codon:yes stop_codon:yes gene_type:complete
MKIIFLSGGAREKALRNLLEKGENIEAVIVPFITKSNDRFKNVIYTAIEFGVKVIPVKKNEIFKILNDIDFELLISCGFPYILNESVINLSKLAINVHPTLLPKYRGYRSAPYIIMNGEDKSGITIHLLTKEMDKGDIILQESFDVSKFDTTKSLFKKAQEVEVDVLYDTVQIIKTGNIKYIRQDETKATEYNYIRTPKDSEIDSSKSLNELYNYIRACDVDDYPAFFYVNKQKVFIKLWRDNDDKNKYQI